MCHTFARETNTLIKSRASYEHHEHYLALCMPCLPKTHNERNAFKCSQGDKEIPRGRGGDVSNRPRGSCRCGSKSIRGNFVPAHAEASLMKFVKQHKEEFLIPFSRRFLLRDVRQIRSQLDHNPLPSLFLESSLIIFPTCERYRHLKSSSTLSSA